MFVLTRCKDIRIGDIIGDSSDNMLKMVVDVIERQIELTIQFQFFYFPSSWKDAPEINQGSSVLYSCKCNSNDLVTIYRKETVIEQKI